MITIYHANTSLEAHMIKNMLEQEGIEAEIQGEHLQGGMGELQAMGLVRVLVEDKAAAAAKQIVEQWETANPSEPDYVLQRNPQQRFGDVLLGFVLGVTTMLLISRYY